MSRLDTALDELRSAVGGRHVVEGADAQGYLEDFWGRASGKALCVVLPGSTEEVSAVLAICQKHRIAVFPQGGNTSTCLGSVPDSAGRSIVLSLRRMNRVLAVDPDDNSLVAQAGCILADIQKAAAKVDRLFPLSLGAEGSCQIGGNVSTNAGGTSVLRYGNMRDLVLGLEAVLPDGRIWNGLRTLRKNNTGYDLKHLFIGAEGSLGIVTAVALKLFPSLPEPVSLLVSFREISVLPSISAPLTQMFGSSIIAMELMSASEIRIVRRYNPDIAFPSGEADDWFLLVDIATSDAMETTGDKLEAALAPLLEAGGVRDAIVTTSQSQREGLWHVRHSVTESHRKYGMGMSHDIAVPPGQIPRFIETAGAEVARRFPDAEIAVVGHIGDGNLHYNVIFEQSRWDAIGDKPEMRRKIFKTVYDIAAALNGTFSAEHGIGALHLAEMQTYKAAVELDLMRDVKALFDPHNLMNPGRLLPPP